jgi:YHS domain-containing protein
MKTPRSFLSFIGFAGLLVVTSLFSRAADGQSEPAAKAYPLTTCVVSGEKLGTMGKPFVHSFEGREVQFCCKACLKEFNKDSKKFLAKLDAASKAKNADPSK